MSSAETKMIRDIAGRMNVGDGVSVYYNVVKDDGRQMKTFWWPGNIFETKYITRRDSVSLTIDITFEPRFGIDESTVSFTVIDKDWLKDDEGVVFEWSYSPLHSAQRTEGSDVEAEEATGGSSISRKRKREEPSFPADLTYSSERVNALESKVESLTKAVATLQGIVSALPSRGIHDDISVPQRRLAIAFNTFLNRKSFVIMKDGDGEGLYRNASFMASAECMLTQFDRILWDIEESSLDVYIEPSREHLSTTLHHQGCISFKNFKDICYFFGVSKEVSKGKIVTYKKKNEVLSALQVIGVCKDEKDSEKPFLMTVGCNPGNLESATAVLYRQTGE